MSRTHLLPFGAEHVEAAGVLLAARHATHRLAEPLLDADFAQQERATEAVASAFGLPEASGVVAVREGQLLGYLLGAPKPDPMWGPNVWVESAGSCAADPERARDLYAAAAAEWVGRGWLAHYVLQPASDARLLDAWYRLGFGQQHAHAVREVPDRPHRPVPGVVVRGARHCDIGQLARLDRVLPEHQSRSPVFSAGPVSSLAEAAAEWHETLADTRFCCLVAEVDGHVVGSAIGCPLELSSGNSGLLRPPHAGFLGFVSVLPAARGHGVGRALGQSVIDWTAEAGFTSVAADWRVTNLLASRAWPRLGFRPAFLRLHRLIGH